MGTGDRSGIGSSDGCSDGISDGKLERSQLVETLGSEVGESLG